MLKGGLIDSNCRDRPVMLIIPLYTSNIFQPDSRPSRQFCALIRYTILRTIPTTKALQFLYIWDVANYFKTQRYLAITSVQSSKFKYF